MRFVYFFLKTLKISHILEIFNWVAYKKISTISKTYCFVLFSYVFFVIFTFLPIMGPAVQEISTLRLRSIKWTTPSQEICIFFRACIASSVVFICRSIHSMIQPAAARVTMSVTN